MADLKLTVDYSELVAAAKTTDQTKQAIRLLGQQFSRTGDQSAYMRAVNQIVASQKNLSVSARMSRGEIMKLANQYKQATAFTDQLSKAQMQLNATTQGSTRHMNRMGVVTQQAGYQIGDFLVQVQSGTNPLVAFGQQATQLAGVMTLFGGKFILLGSILGITIPLVTAIGAAFMRTRQGAKTLDDAVTKLKDSTNTLREGFKNLSDDEIGEEFGDLSRAVKTLETNMISLNRAAQLEALVETLQMFREAGSAGKTEGFFSGMANALSFGVVGQTRSQIEEGAFADLGFDMARSTFLSYQETMEAFAREGDVAGLLAEYNRFLEDAQDGTGEITTEGRVLANTMREVLLLLAQQTAEANGSAQAARDAAEAEKEREQAARETQRQAERTAQFVAEQRANLAFQERLYSEIAKYGEDSLQVERERSLQARIAYENELKRQQVGQELIPILMQQYDAMVRSREEADRVNAALDQVESANLNSFNDQVRMLATLLGTSADEAARLLSNMPVGMTFGNRGALSGYTGEELLPPARRQPRGAGGGASGPNAVERLQQEIAFRQRTLNLSKEEKALQTEIFRITNALGNDRNKYSSDFIANLAQQNLAIQEQERVIEQARQQQEQLADSIANSFGDAFMSIVDGTKSTKDAFKQMAAAIVRDLYQVYVMKRLIGSAEAGTGIAGAIGRLIGLESGGTMTANRPYIVGERGPELVIPGRSSTVTNADLTRKSMGGSDAVIVNNNINVTGGTDPAAIRQEVAKLMPTITNATKSAVIDARRRGGQMKAAFG